MSIEKSKSIADKLGWLVPPLNVIGLSIYGCFVLVQFFGKKAIEILHISKQ